MKRTLFLALTFLSLAVFAQNSYKVALVLPFESERAIGRLESIANAKDLTTANKIRLPEDAVMSLDFYQGLQQALSEDTSETKIELHVYDCYGNDSILTELLKSEELKTMDVMVGPLSTANAKLVADFCRQNKIVNLQPFSPSKSVASDNPYHIKLAPSIDAHIDAMYQSMVDSFPTANVILYTPKIDKNLQIAQRFDSLLNDHNKTAERKLVCSMLNTQDMTVGGKKTTLSELLSLSRQNILVITSYDEAFIQGTMRNLFEVSQTKGIVVYGMPTWLNGEVLRMDYLNEYHTRISDAFYADSANARMIEFATHYSDIFHQQPSRYSFLGFDVMNLLLGGLKDFGKDFPAQITTQRYKGCGYKFDVVKVMKGDTLNYYENRFVNVLKVEDYRLQKVW